MRARVLFVLVAVSTLAVVEPAVAKTDIVEVTVTGPGLPKGIHIDGPGRMWESGIDIAGGLDDTRSDSVEALGLAKEDLGPRYLVTYQFSFNETITQDLYPYAKRGPVTHTSSGQEVDIGVDEMAITAGWYQASEDFFEYLAADVGLPETVPVPPESSSRATATEPLPWAAIAATFGALAGMSLFALVIHRRSSHRAGLRS